MPAAVPAVMAIGMAAIAGESITAIAMIGALTLATTLLSQALAPDAPDFGDMDRGGMKLNTRDTQEPLKVVYGKQLVGGNDVFLSAAGDKNKALWIVQTLAEGECDSIAQADGVDQFFLDDKLYNEYGGNVTYYFHNGASDQTYDTNLAAEFPGWNDNMRNTCYIVIRLWYDTDYFNNFPKRQVLLKGKKLYDFRDGTTVWSDNPVLGLYDYLINSRYGLNRSSSAIDITSWTSAANYCDIKGFTLNLAIISLDSAQDIIDRICHHFRGQLVWYDGKFYLRYADLNYETSCMTINDDLIATGTDGRDVISISQPSMFNKADAVRAKFIDPDRNYVVDDVLIGDSLGVVKEIKFPGCTDREIASNLGTYALERLKLDRVISLTGRDDCLQLEPHDVVTLTSTALGISDQTMRVQRANIAGSGLIDLSLMYESDDLYDDDYDSGIEGTYECSLPDKDATIPAVNNVSATEETYNYRLRTFTRLRIAFDEPDYPWFDCVEVWWSDDNTNWEHLFNATSDFCIDPIEEGITHYLRLKTVNVFGGKTSDANDYKITKLVTGYASYPTSLGSLEAIVNSNTINLYSAKVDNPDIELYEFRLGASWGGGIFLAALRSPNLSLYGVKPGTHTFYCNTLSNNGEYGETPKSMAAVLQGPPDGWTVQATETCDYDGVGTHDNTEHTTYNLDDYLKCSHTAGVLVGTYTSPIYDRTTSGRYLVYALADIVITGDGTTWDDQTPTGTTWDDVSADSRTWNEIFELSAATQVKMTLKYGDASPPTNEVEKLEILSAIVTGRYFQLEIEITDPSAAVNGLVENFELKFCQ